MLNTFEEGKCVETQVFFGITLTVMVLFSMYINSCPLVFAGVYVVDYHRMPADLPGDVNCDGKVDIRDVARAAAAFGSYPGHPKWDSQADLNGDHKVDIRDIAIAAAAFGKHEEQPVENSMAYSSTLEFYNPVVVRDEIHYYFYAIFYVPQALSGQHFSFVAEALDHVQAVKIDSHPKDGSGSDVRVDLGSLGTGFHLFEFELVQIASSGWLYCHIESASGPYAWFTRFRLYVPNYSENTTEYSIKTLSWFPGDTYFLCGVADDYITNVMVQAGILWENWMWDMGPTYGAIYSWGDGFLYPLGWRGPDSLTISFTYGEIKGEGLLDFRYVSFTSQRDKIGAPKYCAAGKASSAYYCEGVRRVYGNVENGIVYSGSMWNGTEGASERFFEVRSIVKCNFTEMHEESNTDYGWGAAEVGLRVGWAGYVLPKANNDVGITLNFTAINFTNYLYLLGGHWELALSDYCIDVYSYPGLELDGMEFRNPETTSESIVNPDWTAYADYLGTVIMCVSSGLEQPEGTAVGLAIKGITTATKIIRTQPLPPFAQTISEYTHNRMNATSCLSVPISESKSAAIFVKLNPSVGYTCGLTKIVLRGTISAEACAGIFPPTPYPMANIEMMIYVPWFIWGPP